MSVLRDKIKDNGHDIEVVRTKINAQKKYLRDLSAMNTAHRTEKETAIEQIYSEIAELNDYNAQHMDSVASELDTVSKKLESLNTKKQKVLEFQSTFKTQAKAVAKEAKFFDEHDTCPTCEQSIPDVLREDKKSAATKRAKELNQALVMSKEEMEKYETESQTLSESYEKARDIQNVIQQNQSTITRLQRNVESLKREIAELTDTHSQFSEANAELESLNKELEDTQDEKYKLNEQYSYNQVSSELLKDSGIKTKIIKQYIPVINQLTNKYLQILDFFVHFDLDENFSETIRSRHRDAFTYDSFSEGEKQRIDLSLLFTWRQVAKMKNSVATNLLILDETFDSSLDEEGVDNLMKILYTLGEDTNVFVISHKSELEDAAFSRKLEFVKDKNFSKIKA
jgi:DNA repair exonuclease SbcCD ATPase subunit